MIKGVIFDLDGTTINTLNELHLSMNETLQEFGLPLKTVDEVRMGIGRRFHNLILACVPEEAGEEKRGLVEARFKEVYAKHYLESKPYPGVPELLEELQELGVKIAANSNKGDEYTKNIMFSNFPGINFVAVFGARDNVPLKPDPYSANEIAQLMGLNNDEVVYIGDSEPDMTTGHNAGMKTLACLWGFRDRKTLEEAGADAFAESPEEILEYVKSR